MAVECPRCNTVSYSRRTTCGTCGNGLSSTRSNPSPYPLRQDDMMSLKHQKMAVFDIDATLFDTTQRNRNAIRAGVLGKDGSRPKGDRAFYKFLDKHSNPDEPISGTVDFVNSLARKNYVIAYLTARPRRVRKKTIETLEKTGYPVFDDHDNTPMVYLKIDGDESPKFKQDKLKQLQRRFNVLYFYDDLEANREMARALDIPGVYDLRERLGIVVSNPPTGGSKGPDGELLPDGMRWIPGLGTVRDPPQGRGWHKVVVPVGSGQGSKDAKQAVADKTGLPLSEIYEELPANMDFWDGPWESATRLRISGSELPSWEYKFYYKTNPRQNPMPKPRKKKNRREPARIYMKRLLSSPKMNAQFPDSAQRYAVSLSLVKKHYGLAAVNRVTAKTNPSYATCRVCDNRQKITGKYHQYVKCNVCGNTKWGAADLSHRWVLKENPSEVKPSPQLNLPESGLPYDKWLATAVLKGQCTCDPYEMLREGGEVYSSIWTDDWGGFTGYRCRERNEIYSDSLGLDVYSELTPLPECKCGCAYCGSVGVGSNIGEAFGLKNNPSDAHWATMNPDFQMGLIKESAQEWADYLNANRKKGEGKWSLSSATSSDGTISWFVTNSKTLQYGIPDSWFDLKEGLRENPSLESKGRELYAKFNGKKPASVKRESINIPPVWVKIGEGGTWSIGYNSGKETGDSNQKYIHNFNEDSKDGNFPDLYAAINEDGQAELLVLRGGTFKLETRDDGLTWLVD